MGVRDISTKIVCYEKSIDNMFMHNQTINGKVKQLDMEYGGVSDLIWLLSH